MITLGRVYFAAALAGHGMGRGWCKGGAVVYGKRCILHYRTQAREEKALQQLLMALPFYGRGRGVGSVGDRRCTVVPWYRFVVHTFASLWPRGNTSVSHAQRLLTDQLWDLSLVITSNLNADNHIFLARDS